jgi:hypothetical protein
MREPSRLEFRRDHIPSFVPGLGPGKTTFGG